MSDTLTSPAARIAARGRRIPICDGTELTLRYSMLSMEALERDFGNMAAITEHVNTAVRALQAVQLRATGGTLTDEQRKLADDTSLGDVFTKIVQVLLPGLLDERAVDPRMPDSEPVWLDGRPDVAKRVLDPRYLDEYMAAFKEAFVEAFPAGPARAGGAVPPTVQPETAPAASGPPELTTVLSPGLPGTTPHAVSPGGPTPLSGA